MLTGFLEHEPRDKLAGALAACRERVDVSETGLRVAGNGVPDLRG